MHPSPRPILKRTASAPTAEKHAVHFPPSPALTRTFDAHDPATYDRSPIVVAPNVCALPERGGRTYVLGDAPSPSRRRSPSKSGRVLHPRAMRDSQDSLPSLIPDLSSESDESDGFPSPHLENQEFHFGPSNQHGLKAADDSSNLLAFLPYAPAHPYYATEGVAHVEKPRRRKERKNDTPRDNDRIRTEEDNAVSPRRKSRSSTISSPSSSSFSLSDSFSSFALRDDGCLGGF